MTEQPLPLVIPTQPNPPPRPTRRDRAVLKAAAERMAPEIIRWFDDDWDNDLPALIEQLMDVLARGLSDGYEMAKCLEDEFMWEPNAELVEILDGSGDIYIAHAKAVAGWVEINAIKPTRAIGDVVHAQSGGVVRRSYGVGPIVRIDEEHATYIVQTNRFLEERPDQAGKYSGYVVEYENVSAPPSQEA